MQPQLYRTDGSNCIADALVGEDLLCSRYLASTEAAFAERRNLRNHPLLTRGPPSRSGALLDAGYSSDSPLQRPTTPSRRAATTSGLAASGRESGKSLMSTVRRSAPQAPAAHAGEPPSSAESLRLSLSIVSPQYAEAFGPSRELPRTPKAR